jgi:cytochrome c oxidase subunit 3
VNRAGVNASVGMAIFLGATAMLFAALMLAYAVLRAQAPAWPPAGAAHLPRALLGANTLVLVAASVALRRRPVIALALGAAFAGLQVAAWRAAVGAGVGPASGAYGSVFFALSGLHAAHVVGGVAALAVVVARRARPRLVTTYWDFLLAVWAVIYFAVCLR